MAAVSLTQAVVSLATDLSQSVSFYTNARSRGLEVPVRVVRMANGSLRPVRRAGKARNIGVTAVSVSPAVQRTLEDWAGEDVLFRDKWGQKLYGVLLVGAVVDYTDVERRDVALTISEKTVSEVA